MLLKCKTEYQLCIVFLWIRTAKCKAAAANTPEKKTLRLKMYESLLCIDFVTWSKCPTSCLTISIIVIKNKSCGNANKYSKGRLNDSPNRTTTIPVLTATHGVCEKSTDSQAIFLLPNFCTNVKNVYDSLSPHHYKTKTKDVLGLFCRARVLWLFTKRGCFYRLCCQLDCLRFCMHWAVWLRVTVAVATVWLCTGTQCAKGFKKWFT